MGRYPFLASLSLKFRRHAWVAPALDERRGGVPRTIRPMQGVSPPQGALSSAPISYQSHAPRGKAKRRPRIVLRLIWAVLLGHDVHTPFKALVVTQDMVLLGLLTFQMASTLSWHMLTLDPLATNELDFSQVTQVNLQVSSPPPPHRPCARSALLSMPTTRTRTRSAHMRVCLSSSLDAHCFAKRCCSSSCCADKMLGLPVAWDDSTTSPAYSLPRHNVQRGGAKSDLRALSSPSHSFSATTTIDRHRHRPHPHRHHYHHPRCRPHRHCRPHQNHHYCSHHHRPHTHCRPHRHRHCRVTLPRHRHRHIRQHQNALLPRCHHQHHHCHPCRRRPHLATITI